MVTLEPVGQSSATAIRAILADRALLLPLLAGGTADPCLLAAIWCGEREDGACRRAIRCAASGAVAGGIALARGEITYFIAPAHQRRGLGLAALRAVQAGALGPVTALGARTAHHNIPSRRLLETAGFRFSGFARQAAGAPRLALYDWASPHPALATRSEENRHGRP